MNNCSTESRVQGAVMSRGCLCVPHHRWRGLLYSVRAITLTEGSAPGQWPMLFEMYLKKHSTVIVADFISIDINIDLSSSPPCGILFRLWNSVQQNTSISHTHTRTHTHKDTHTQTHRHSHTQTRMSVVYISSSIWDELYKRLTNARQTEALY